ncbi:hypothetical protein [Vibrio sp. 10N.261.51.F12]|uniref:hypothetical protein n=1 Tax=Vibrio sp. 10N.261.51.F12 TaxID=3229679 RepID=UPI00354C403A
MGIKGNSDEIRVKVVEDKSKPDLSFLKQVVLLVLGSLIFVGIIEGYKSDLGRDKDLVKEYYRPVKTAYTVCSPAHNLLFLKYGELAGSYQLLFDEMKHMFEVPNVSIQRDYQVFPMSILKSNGALKKEIKSLENKVKECRVKVYSSYEELALVTGTFNEYEKLSIVHFGTINNQHAKLKESIPREFKDMNPQDLVVMMRELFTMDLSNEENRTILLERVDKIAKPVIEYEMEKMKSEQAMFMENQRFHKSLNKVFLNEISRRNSQGFLSWLV